MRERCSPHRMAAAASDNPDEFLHRIVAKRAEQLSTWAAQCDCFEIFHGDMAVAATRT